MYNTSRQDFMNAPAPLSVYDNERVQDSFVRKVDVATRETTLLVEGITCPSCIRKIEQGLAALGGVSACAINFSSHQARVRWDPRRLRLSGILAEIARLGYRAFPCGGEQEQAQFAESRRAGLLRIGLAGVLAMQVMMISIGLYAGQGGAMDAELRDFLRWVAALLTLPVLVYCARPFYLGAMHGLRNLAPGMDVPVSLGLTLAYLGSLWATWTQAGHVYFDSVVMLVFFLSLSRYLEFMARHKANAQLAGLKKIIPATARRLVGAGATRQRETVPVADLQPGDCVALRAGEIIPADGVVLRGQSQVDEALITGESLPVAKGPGARLVGGSVNIASPLQMRVEQVGEGSVLRQITRLAERAQAHKSRLTGFADRVASWFVVGVLALAAVVSLYWWQVDPALALPVTISVLVVTCPCALALATPSAVASASAALLQRGIACTSADALERVAASDDFIFDKTGTLTTGALQLHEVRPCAAMSAAQCLAVAAALEQDSEHPLGRALARAGAAGHCVADDLVNYPGGGLCGRVDGRRYYLGSRRFIKAQTGLTPPEAAPDPATLAFLADAGGVLAAFSFADELRPGIAALLGRIRQAGKRTVLLSGDRRAAVTQLSASLGFDERHGELDPAEKLALLQRNAAAGRRAVMFGDGINDVPSLAAADVAISMNDATDLAQVHSDIVILNDNVDNVAFIVLLARRTMNIIKQNIAWAVGYNLGALPAACLGYLTPWMAAIGMSLSSLLVVLNALRLMQTGTGAGQ
ncbi:MAG: cation-translocating P-type ATPase [Gammaproteobacteria bacterium]|nr:cation-translocating P-type ATPase [Gammaproteobacteria bacterium]